MQIIAELVARGVTQAKIANMLKVFLLTVSQFISGTRKSTRIREAIALVLGKPVSELWPDNKKHLGPCQAE